MNGYKFKDGDSFLDIVFGIFPEASPNGKPDRDPSLEVRLLTERELRNTKAQQ